MSFVVYVVLKGTQSVHDAEKADISVAGQSILNQWKSHPATMGSSFTSCQMQVNDRLVEPNLVQSSRFCMIIDQTTRRASCQVIHLVIEALYFMISTPNDITVNSPSEHKSRSHLLQTLLWNILSLQLLQV